jgi:hypothetical protein
VAFNLLFENVLFYLYSSLTCRGLLQFGNVTYGIEPLESSIGFEHVIYQVKNKKKGIPLYAEKDIESRALPYKIQTVKVGDSLSKSYGHYCHQNKHCCFLTNYFFTYPYILTQTPMWMHVPERSQLTSLKTSFKSFLIFLQISIILVVMSPLSFLILLTCTFSIVCDQNTKIYFS